MVVLTHAHAAKAMLGQGYDVYSRQRRNIMSQLIKQAAGSAQVCVDEYVCMRWTRREREGVCVCAPASMIVQAIQEEEENVNVFLTGVGGGGMS